MKLSNLMKLLVQSLTLIPCAFFLTQCVVEPLGSGNANQLPAKAENQVPEEAAVPQKVINDCLATLSKQIPDRKMAAISSKRGETSFIVDVEVEGVENPWRCYHDGTKCTGTEYQGEG